MSSATVGGRSSRRQVGAPVLSRRGVVGRRLARGGNPREAPSAPRGGSARLPSALPPRVLPPRACAPPSSLLLPPRGRAYLPASAQPPSLRYGHPRAKPLPLCATSLAQPSHPPPSATDTPVLAPSAPCGRAALARTLVCPEDAPCITRVYPDDYPCIPLVCPVYTPCMARVWLVYTPCITRV